MDDAVTPGSPGERERMPSWVPKAVALFWLGFIAVELVEGLLVALRTLLLAITVALFLSFAMEPAVNSLARRGWRRGGATGLVFVATVLIFGVFVFAIGSLVVGQVRNFVDEAPQYVQDLEDWINDTFDADVDFDDLADELDDPEGPARRFVEDLAGDALKAGLTAVAVVFQVLTIGLFTFYLVADGPRLRRTICSLLRPDRQQVVLRAWELAIDKTGGYLYSRLILAGLSTAFHWIVLTVMGVPYALALALWVGVVSQFIPVVGTYLAGALAVLVGVLNEPLDGVVILAFVVVYQQVENYLFAPRVTAQTMSLHPAVAFGAVIAGAAVLGPIGALLALPAAAVVQAFVSELGERHEVVESHLTAEPSPRRGRRRQRDSGGDGARDAR
ncbi:MAG: AI-2E family transporter [Acidimicrobiia bacterium]|nr:MAG: AI-2E family transporter [Acidimicrobiia bacterium]